MRLAANFFSWIFHPLLITTWLVLFLGYFFPPLLGINPAIFFRFVLFIALITFVFPAVNIALMIRLSGPNASITMPARRQRIAPFVLISLIYCFFAGLFIYKRTLGITFTNITVITASLVLVGTVLTFFFKVSVHSLAMGGVSGILLGLNQLTDGLLFYPAVASIVFTGLVMSSRLVLNAHTLREVLSGGIVGLITGLGGMVLLFR